MAAEIFCRIKEKRSRNESREDKLQVSCRSYKKLGNKQLKKHFPANPIFEVNPKIVNGSDASNGQFPFAVSFQHDGNHWCGGSIISEQHVLTAGHCCNFQVISPQVKAGIIDINETGIIIPVAEKIIHPEFKSSNLANDLCILKLSEPFELSELVQVIQLDRVNDDKVENCTVVGWGKLKYMGELATTLQYLEGATVPYQQCVDMWGTHDENGISSSHVCALPLQGQGACNGDSGGPLFTYEADGQAKQIGIVSWGYPCGKNYPDIFAKVSAYIDWIDSIITA